MGGAAARGTCAACAALARLWRRTSATRDRPARQPHTARPTRRVSCRSQAVRSSWPCCAPLRRAHCRLRARRVARVVLAETAWVRPKPEPRPCVGAPLPRRGSARARAHPTLALSLSPSLSLSPTLAPAQVLRTSLGLAATSSAGRQGPGVHVAHFLPDVPHRPERPVRRPKSPVVSPTRFDAWSSRGGRLEWAQGEHPHVLGLCDVCWKGVAPRTLPAPKLSFLEFCPPFR